MAPYCQRSRSLKVNDYIYFVYRHKALHWFRIRKRTLLMFRVRGQMPRSLEEIKEVLQLIRDIIIVDTFVAYSLNLKNFIIKGIQITHHYQLNMFPFVAPIRLDRNVKIIIDVLDFNAIYNNSIFNCSRFCFVAHKAT